MTAPSAYDDALRLAATHGTAFYVNRHAISRDEEVLAADGYRGRLCCAVAHPDGQLERVVRGYSHAVALSQILNLSTETTK